MQHGVSYPLWPMRLGWRNRTARWFPEDRERQEAEEECAGFISFLLYGILFICEYSSDMARVPIRPLFPWKLTHSTNRRALVSRGHSPTTQQGNWGLLHSLHLSPLFSETRRVSYFSVSCSHGIPKIIWFWMWSTNCFLMFSTSATCPLPQFPPTLDSQMSGLELDWISHILDRCTCFPCSFMLLQ